MSMKIVSNLGSVAAATLLLASCTVGPDYKKPDAPVPVSYKELEGWKIAQPQQAASNAPWWSVYNDLTLDQLERQIDINNQNLKLAEASYRQAVALLSEARSGYFPSVTLDASGQRARSTAGTTSTVARIRNSFDLSANASWDIDVWGRIRRTVESADATAQASAADLASARLSAQATLATTYFQLRISDEVKRLLEQTVDAFNRSLQITQNRYNVGVAARSDVATAQAQLETTRSQLVAVGVQRATLEHAIAVLVGKPPADFSVQPVQFAMGVPVAPTGVPSTLLERRPDIAAAERLMASANAEIGVAEAAYYPDFTISGAFGFANSKIDDLLRASSRTWSLGANASMPLFNAGLTSATLAAARAVYDQRVASYRQTVLTGFQQVEDNLSTLRVLEQQADVQAGAVTASEQAEQLTLNQYQAGTLAYTSVVTAQATTLNNKQSALTIFENRLLASVTLIEALGGGWDSSQLPSTDALRN
jgi:NodT family efflux transporter outer membrane factor (OMF) lipoprotein